MELALSLGEPSKPFSFLEKTPKLSRSNDLEFCMGLGKGFKSQHESDSLECEKKIPSDPPLQLCLPWVTDNDEYGRGLDVNHLPLAVVTTTDESEGVADSSPNSTVSSFQMDFRIRNYGSNKGKRCVEAERTSDDDDEFNGLTRKKLRLSKEQSAFLEESFKEHTTLNPKQKLALAKQLNLRPRQVEVWFQNRRARTKLKQTEVDCEYLKRCCETLTEENKRLQKELQDLRALKTSQPFYLQQSPATTLTMCPSCERVATASTTKASTASAVTGDNTRGCPPFFSSMGKCEKT